MQMSTYKHTWKRAPKNRWLRLDDLDSNIDVVTPTLPLDAILPLRAEKVQILFCEYLWKNGKADAKTAADKSAGQDF